MSEMSAVWETALAVIGSLGGGGLIVLGLSKYIGNIAATRTMQQEAARLEVKVEEDLQSMRKEMEFYREIDLKAHRDKLDTYRLVVDIMSELLADIDLAFKYASGEDNKDTTSAKAPDMLQTFDEFNRGRMKAYGYLSMVASQEIMDAYNDLCDHLLATLNSEIRYVFKDVRARIVVFINAVRFDIGIDVCPIEYKGDR